MRRDFNARVITTITIKHPDKKNVAIAARYMQKRFKNGKVHVRRNRVITKFWGLLKPSMIFSDNI